MNPRIYFLTYLERSGSTLLAQKLDSLENIAVSIEASFDDGIMRGKCEINSEKDLNSYLQNLYRDKKFLAWNVEKGEFEKALRNYVYPLHFKNLLSEALKLHFKNSQAINYIYKNGGYYRCLDKIQNLFPGSKIIFINRDPRAIFNSQKKSVDSRTHRLMQTDIVKFVRIYKRAQMVLNRNRNNRLFHVVKYENLLLDEDKEMKCLTAFLDISYVKKYTNQKYYHKIPDSQKHLHVNLISEKYIMDRINAWEKELGEDDIYFLELTLRSELKSNGYALQNSTFRRLERNLRFILCLPKFIYYCFLLNYVEIYFPQIYKILRRLKGRMTPEAASSVIRSPKAV